MSEAAAINARYPTKFERAILTKADAWLAGILAPADAPAPLALRPARMAAAATNPRLILLCMTPRSGSTALSAAMASTERLGLGGERLNHYNRTLREIATEQRPRSKRELLERVIDATRTENGVAQIKCDLPQILPFLLDPPCHAILARAHFVYLTRGDLLAQAISRYRSNAAGIAHARKGEKTEGQAPYSFAAISSHLDHLTRMMASYEKAFAMLGIHPLRITYEQITAEPGKVVRDIARLAGVGIKAADISGLDAGGYKKVSGSNNDSLREQFLAEAPSHVLVPGHRPARVRRKAGGGPDGAGTNRNE